MALDDLYQVTCSYHTPGGVVSIGQAYALTSGDYGIDSGTAMAEQWISNQGMFLSLCLTSSCEIDQVRCDPITVPEEFPGIQNANGMSGVEAGEPLPNNLAAVISKTCDAGNARFNGRTFLAGCPELQQVDGTWSAPYLATLQAMADSLLTDVVIVLPAPATFTPVVVSRWIDGVARINPHGFFAVSNTAKPYVRQQRRRATKRLGIA